MFCIYSTGHKHSLFRLTIPLALIILFSVGLGPVIGDGPFWFVIKDYSQNCANNWWASLLYINNFYKAEEQCLGQTWYLSVDMQLFLISPLVFMPMYRWGICSSTCRMIRIPDFKAPKRFIRASKVRFILPALSEHGIS